MAGFLSPGTLLKDRYSVGRALGAGGFGVTYLGFDETLECRVTIKELLPTDMASRVQGDPLEVVTLPGRGAEFELLKVRFLEEAKRLASMRGQAGIVGVYDYFEENNTAYYIMDYLEGTTLEQLARERGGRIEPNELFSMLDPLFDALEMLHKSGTIHRDISPDNIMVTDGKACLIDFGNARQSWSTHFTGNYKDLYAPVEQRVGREQDARTDIYSLCATIYACLTGTAPPSAAERQALATLRRPTELGVALTPEQESALLRGMSVRKSMRQRSVRELREGLCPSTQTTTTSTETLDETLVSPAPVEPEARDESEETTAKTRVRRDTVDERRERRTPRLMVPIALALAVALSVLGAASVRSCGSNLDSRQVSGNATQETLEADVPSDTHAQTQQEHVDEPEKDEPADVRETNTVDAKEEKADPVDEEGATEAGKADAESAREEKTTDMSTADVPEETTTPVPEESVAPASEEIAATVSTEGADQGETVASDYVFPAHWEGSYLGNTIDEAGESVPATRMVWFDLKESNGEVTGTCSVGTDDGQSVVDGTFEVEGSFDINTRSIALTGTEWVYQGDLWGMRNFWGTVSPDMKTMSGRCIGTNSGKQGDWSAEAR